MKMSRPEINRPLNRAGSTSREGGHVGFRAVLSILVVVFAYTSGCDSRLNRSAQPTPSETPKSSQSTDGRRSNDDYSKDHELLLEVAIGRKCRPAHVASLVDSGASPSAKTEWGVSAFQLSLELGAEDCAKMLLEAGADIRSVSKNGQNAIHSAVLGGAGRDLASLIGAGVPFDLPDIQGVTPLMIAAYTANRDAIKILQSAGADPCRRDKRGRRAADISRLSSTDLSADLACRVSLQDAPVR